MKKINNLNEVLAAKLEAMYDGEKQLQHLLPSVSELVQHPNLKAEINKYVERSVEKRCKLKRIFSYLLVQEFKIKNKIIESMLNDIREIMHLASESYLRDVMLVACIQSINHYNVTNYRTALALAIELNLENVADLLQEILQWEKETVTALEKLTFQKIGQRRVNSFDINVFKYSPLQNEM